MHASGLPSAGGALTAPWPIQVDRNLYYLFGRGEGLVDFVVEHPSASRVHFALIHDGAHKASVCG